MHDAYMYDGVTAVILEKLAFIHVLHAKEATRRISLCSLVAGCTVTINIQINPYFAFMLLNVHGGEMAY